VSSTACDGGLLRRAALVSRSAFQPRAPRRVPGGSRRSRPVREGSSSRLSRYPWTTLMRSWLVWGFVGLAGACGTSGARTEPVAAGGVSLGGSPARSGASNGGTAGTLPMFEGCPEMGSFPGPTDPCAGCYGLACEPGQTCTGSFHQGDNAGSSCTCVEGQMVCCVSTSRYVSCNYGDRTPPECPARAPEADEPCGPAPLSCSYPNGCNEPEVTAFCTGETWELGERAPPFPSGGAAGAPCVAGAAGAAGADSGAGGAGGAP
jgi:hypothetical protein